MKSSEMQIIPVQSPQEQSFFAYQSYYPGMLMVGDLCRSCKSDSASGFTDEMERDLARRIIAYYKKTNEEYPVEASGIWAYLSTLKKDVHKILLKEDIDSLLNVLNNPATSMLLHGFDFPTAQSIKNIGNPMWLLHYRNLCEGSLRRMAEALAVIPMVYPEAYGITSDTQSNTVISVSTLLERIESKLSIQVTFPNGYENALGLYTERGVASFRAIQSLFQAFRISQIVGPLVRENGENQVGEPTILEIGGGTGRTAFYAFKMGFRNYTIVDLPLTGIVQAYFLSKSLGLEHLSLDGEKRLPYGVHLLSPPALFKESATSKAADSAFLDRVDYDVIVNFDSLVEMSREDALRYMEFIINNGKIFFSVNRESKSFTARGLLDHFQVDAVRNPYWLRQGYAEEIAYFL